MLVFILELCFCGLLEWLFFGRYLDVCAGCVQCTLVSIQMWAESRVTSKMDVGVSFVSTVEVGKKQSCWSNHRLMSYVLSPKGSLTTTACVHSGPYFTLLFSIVGSLFSPFTLLHSKTCCSSNGSANQDKCMFFDTLFFDLA